jgi:tRNA dimethylallyltransferase
LLDSNKIIVILGPTASGKTEVSIELSKYLDLEIISADSRQIYKYLDIGTAKPTKEEQSAVPHHFIDILDPAQYYSAGKFGNDAEKVVQEIFLRGRIPCVVGGSGLYIQSLCEGLFDENDNENDTRLEIRICLENKFKKSGIENLYNELKEIDIDSANKYGDMNPRRIIRALEYYYSNHIPLSKAHNEFQTNRNFTPVYFGIEHERKELYDRINLRSENMWKSGLIEETKHILEMGYLPSLNSLNTVGYKECIAFLNNELSEKEAIEKIKQNTRHYAKRQLTWFRKNPNIKWLNGNPKNIAEVITMNFTR